MEMLPQVGAGELPTIRYEKRRDGFNIYFNRTWVGWSSGHSTAEAEDEAQVILRDFLAYRETLRKEQGQAPPT